VCDEEDIGGGSGVFGLADDGGVVFGADVADEAVDAVGYVFWTPISSHCQKSYFKMEEKINR
jgi:hypothetical protein